MTIARQHIMHPSISRYYHCMSRCVRHSYICGQDGASGRNFDHRKAWLVDRMKKLSGIFAIDICAYAIMSNHFHIVLYWNIEESACWNDREVIERWCQLYRNPLGLAYLENQPLLSAQQATLSDQVVVWRKRLGDISWYMRCLNEHIARKANREDECTGHFWQSRFRSQALMDEATLLSCMAYVDLNPIRAGLCERLEDSTFTSIQERLQAYAADKRENSTTPQGLLRFADESGEVTASTASSDEKPTPAIPYRLQDYLQLVDWTGRSIRIDKSGSIPAHVPTMLRSLGLDETDWLWQVRLYSTSNKLKVHTKRRAA